MTTLAMRFADNFAPENDTICAHQDVIASVGYVWFGKMGNQISQKTADIIMKNDDPKILLIHSGKVDRYWAHVEKIQWEIPCIDEIPLYYRNNAGAFKTWFKVKFFDNAEKNVMSKCVVASSFRVVCRCNF